MSSNDPLSARAAFVGLLPATPDLLVSAGPGASPTVHSIAPWLAARLGRPAHEWAGKPAADLEGLIPGVSSLIAVALEGEGPVVSGRVETGRTPDTSGRFALVATTVGQSVGDGAQDIAVQVLSPGEKDGLRSANSYFGLIGHGSAMRALFARIDRYADSSAPVLITGESGTGKELVARALHERGPRRGGPFVAVNCAALSNELIESDLFGHEKGAFTGAVSAHRGRFERAHRGTLFLDEIGDMPRRSQTSLLRVLEDGVVERVGAERAIPVSVRVIAATNVPLERAVDARRFREDLFFRLSVLRLHLPALRERREDIPLLVTYFLSVFASQYGRPWLRLTPGALSVLLAYHWPGNVRELKNVLERIVVDTAGEVIGERAFAEWVTERERFTPGGWNLEAEYQARRVATPLVTPYHAAPQHALSAPTIDATFSDLSEPTAPLTKTAALEALAACGGNVTRAARRLGVHRATLYRRLRAWGVSRSAFPSSD